MDTVQATRAPTPFLPSSPIGINPEPLASRVQQPLATVREPIAVAQDALHAVSHTDSLPGRIVAPTNHSVSSPEQHSQSHPYATTSNASESSQEPSFYEDDTPPLRRTNLPIQTMGLGAPNFMNPELFHELLSEPVHLSYGKEFHQLTQWSLENSAQRLKVHYRHTSGEDASGLSKHALTAAFEQATQLPVMRTIEEGLSLTPLNQLAADFPDRSLINRNALDDCAKLGHLFARLLAHNTRYSPQKNVRISHRFSPSIYRALALFAKQHGRNAKVLNALINIAKQPNTAKNLALKTLTRRSRSTGISPIGLLNQIDSLGLNALTKPRQPGQSGLLGKLRTCFSKKNPLDEQEHEQTVHLLKLGFMLEGENDSAIVLALVEKFAPYLEMAKNFSALCKTHALDTPNAQTLESKVYSNLSFKKKLANNTDTFNQFFQITGMDERRQNSPAIDERIKETMIDFFRNNTEETARKFAHFVTASETITEATKIKVALNNDAMYNVPQAHTCANQLDVYIGLFENKYNFNQNLTLALKAYPADPFGFR